MSRTKLQDALRRKLKEVGKETFLTTLADYFGNSAITRLAQVKDSTMLKSLLGFAYGGVIKNNKKKANPKMLAALKRLVDLPASPNAAPPPESGYDSDEIESLLYAVSKKPRTQAGGEGFGAEKLTAAQRLALRLDSPDKASLQTLKTYLEIVDPEADYANKSSAELQNTVKRMQQGQNATDLHKIAQTISGGPEIKPYVMRAVQDRIYETAEQLEDLEGTASTIKKRLDKLAKTADLDPASRQQYLKCVEDYAKFQEGKKQAGGFEGKMSGRKKSSRSLAKDLGAVALLTGAAVGAKKLYDIQKRKKLLKKIQGDEYSKNTVQEWINALPEEFRTELSNVEDKNIDKFIKKNGKKFKKTPPSFLRRFGTKAKALKYLISYFRTTPQNLLYEQFKKNSDLLHKTVKALLCAIPLSTAPLAFNSKGWDLLKIRARDIKIENDSVSSDVAKSNVLILLKLATWLRNAPFKVQKFLSVHTIDWCEDSKSVEDLPALTNDWETTNWLTHFPVKIKTKGKADKTSINLTTIDKLNAIMKSDNAIKKAIETILGAYVKK
jgi:hypothetical protein